MYLLPPHEQIAEIDQIVEYYSKIKHTCYDFKKRFRLIKDLKILRNELLTISA